MNRTWFDMKTLFPEFKDGCFTRDHMTEDREKEWVAFCYEAYENDGFRETYHNNYDLYKEHDGKKYKVIKRLNEKEADLECLPLWTIEFEDGSQITAVPEEICLTETPAFKEKYKDVFKWDF